MKSILFPTDFSKNANASLQYAIQFSKEKNCKLIFFHSFNDANTGRVLNKTEIQLGIIERSTKLRDELKKTYRLLKIPYSQKNTDVIVKFGKNLIELINQTVIEKQINMVIIGTHYASGLKSILFESKTVRLISKSKVPILAIPIDYKFTPIKQIIYSTDLLNTKKELTQLNNINEIFKSKLSTVYFDNGIEMTKQELASKKIIETTGIAFHSIRVEIGSHMITNLTNFIKKKKNSLVCLFHSPKNKILEILLGSNTDELVLHLKSPLLSVKK